MMDNQCDAIIKAFIDLGGTRRISEIDDWINKNYPGRWKDTATEMADMVPVPHGGNTSSSVPENKRVLKRVERGYYCLI